MNRVLRLLVITPLLAACAAPPTMRSARIVPARVPDPSRPRLVAVVPLEGDKTGAITAALDRSLAGISIDGRPYFTVIDTVTMGAAMATRRPSGKPLTDAEAVAIGRATGATGVLTGSVTVESEERQPREYRTVCLRADEDGGCLRWGESPVSCTERETRIALSPRLIVTETGRISYGKTIRARNSAVACRDTPSPTSGTEELVRQAKELVVKEFRKDIAPYFAPAEAPIMDSSEGIPSGEGRDLFIQGLLAAGENRPDRACVLWEQAGRFTPSSPSLRYDLGVCRELAGELESALEEYRQAASLLKGPDETVATAIDRVSKEIAARARAAGETGK